MLSLFVLLTFGGVCLILFLSLLMVQIKLYGQVYGHTTKPMEEHYDFFYYYLSDIHLHLYTVVLKCILVVITLQI